MGLLPQFDEKRLRLLQILGVEAFGEPAVNRGEQFVRVPAFALPLPQACEADRRTQLPGFCLLAARPVERGEIVPFGAFKVALERGHPAPEAQDFRVLKAFLPPGAFDLGDLLVDQVQGILEVAVQRHTFGQERFHGRAAELAAARAPTRDVAVANAFMSHELQLFYDDSVAVRTFKFPIFGLETDRDLLWLIFPLIGMIAYYIVWLALGRLAGMFSFLLGRNRTDAVWLRLIQSTLVITTPLNTERDSEITPFYQAIWRVLTLLVFAIPIIVTLLTIADQTNAIAYFIRQVPGEKFMKDPTAAFLVKLVFQVLVLLLQLGLLGKLIALSVRFGRDQSEAARLIAALET